MPKLLAQMTICLCRRQTGESHYVFDILFNNTTDIQPEVHSTDTQGTNEVNFAILHLFGYQFAPRYKDIQDKVSEWIED